MLRPFRVLDPATVAEASAELGRLGERARVYAGGAELLLLLRQGLLEADYLVNVKRIPGLDVVAWEEGAVRIGATVVHRRLETDPLVRERLPLFAYAESQVGNVRVRNQGTVGGNLCFADPHADVATALLVHEATVRVGGAATRELPLAEFLVGTYETALAPDELLTEIRVPPLPAGWGHAYLRVEQFYRPTLNVAAAVERDDGRLGAARLAVGCVGPKAVRLEELEARLRGLPLAEAQQVVAGARPYLAERLEPVDDLLGSAEYKVYLAGVLLGRALAQAAGSDRESQHA
ncbi:MAG TPA: xanthine dehydrogenase family protein subunit M [Chloroflexota bacterium]|nr:xanthine dehydrogenase family protein subunit M [Chloroflexota bacterium]